MGLGSVAWALAATSMTAVHAAEARALGPGHTAEMPGEDELALLAHDARLASMIVVACGLAIVVAALPRRSGVAAWLGGVAAVVIANATLGRAVDRGSVLLAAGALVLVTGAAAAVASRRTARRHSTQEDGAVMQWPLLGASAVAAGTLPVLVLQGMGSPRYAEWVPADLATSNLLTAVALAVAAVVAAVLLARSAAGVVLGVVMPMAALVVLVQPSGSSWQVRDGAWVMGVVLVLASAPLMLAAAGRSGTRPRRAVAGSALLASGGLLAVVPQLLVPPIIVGGLLGMVVTSPAGAYVNYDGLPVIGGGVLIAMALLVPHLLLRDQAGPAVVLHETSDRSR